MLCLEWEKDKILYNKNTNSESFYFLQLQFLSSVSKHKNKYSYVIRNPVSFVMKNGLKHLQVFFAAVSLEYESWTVI